MENILSKSKKETIEKDSSITLINQKKLTLTGVNEIFSSNEKNILLKCNSKKLIISGENINITKLDVNTGELEATGLFESLKYTSGLKTNLFKRFFK